MTTTTLALKYRPKNLEEVIGHENAVKALSSIVKSGKHPNAMMFTGPSSVGKTTLARAFAASFCGLERIQGTAKDFYEVNAADTRTIDDMRQLISLAKMRPMSYKKRFILVDECQQLLSVPASVQILLKDAEQPHKDMIWIFCSMEPEKFMGSQAGRALMNRCTHYQLQKHTEKDLFRFARRIVKGEEYSRLGKEGCTTLAKNSNLEMRTLANNVQYVMSVSGEDGDELTADEVEGLISKNLETSMEADVVAVRFLTAIYSKAIRTAVKELLSVDDTFKFLMSCQYLNRVVLLDLANNGERSGKYWMTKPAYALRNYLSKEGKKPDYTWIVNVHRRLTDIRNNPSTKYDMDDLLSLVSQLVVGD
jgi:DNA polymerase III gamma/tau subunit